MSGQKIWTQHYQDGWQEKSGDPRLPNWLRVASLAYGMHKANGHAPFAQGQIALVLAKVDEATGEIIPSKNVDRAIRTAVEYGWLTKGSGARCLIVPGHFISGPNGNAYAPCPVHGAQAPRLFTHAA